MRWVPGFRVRRVPGAGVRRVPGVGVWRVSGCSARPCGPATGASAGALSRRTPHSARSCEVAANLRSARVPGASAALWGACSSRRRSGTRVDAFGRLWHLRLRTRGAFPSAWAFLSALAVGGDRPSQRWTRCPRRPAVPFYYLFGFLF